MAVLVACTHGDIGVCGDGVVDPGEACDAAGEGCDDACHLTGATAWTVTRSEPDAAVDILDVAVGASGRIAVLGVTDTDSEYGAPWLLALDATGAELWRTELAAEDLRLLPPHVAVDADDGIYVQTRGLRRFDFWGRAVWELRPDDAGFLALTVADDAVFLADLRALGSAAAFGLRRVDPATGASVWAWSVDDDAIYFPIGLSMADEQLVALVHRASSPAEDGEPVVIVVDPGTGEASAVTPVASAATVLTGIAGLRAGDFVVTGHVEDAWFVRRLGLAGETRWTATLDFHGNDGLADVASGPDDSIVVVGDSRGRDGATQVLHGRARALSSDGTLMWAVDDPPVSPWGGVSARAVAFGPGFLVIAGQMSDGLARSVGWIRRVGPK